MLGEVLIFGKFLREWRVLNTFLVACWLFALGSLSAFAANSDTRDFLTPGQKIHFLNWLNAWCGDAWCSGDYEYTFNSLQCDERHTCKLSFAMETRSPAVTRQVGCTFDGIHKYADIFDSGFLNESFDQAFNACLNQLEAKFKAKD